MRSVQSLRSFLTCLQTRLFLAASMILFSLSSVSVAQQFREVTTEVGLISEATLSWGNPIWADFNNDGFLDLIVPVYHPQAFVYLNNAGGTFTDIRASCGIVPPHLDRSHWRGLAFGDYDGDGNIDLYVAEFPARAH